MTELLPTVAVLVFPGSNDDDDACGAITLLGGDPVRVWHQERELPCGTEAIVLPGGFSYGDYLRCGAIARFAPVMGAVQDFAAAGGPVLGICNGFQVLCEAELLPGVLRPNESLSFICRDVLLRVESVENPFTTGCALGQRLTIPIKHGEGSYFVSHEIYEELVENDQIVLRYEENPNGSVGDIAGVVNTQRNVLGLMPHPEHAVDPLLGSVDGALILGSLIDFARRHAMVTA